MYKYRRVIISVVAGVLVLSIVFGLVAMVAWAAPSSEIREEIDELQEEADELAAQREALEAEIAENESKTLTIVEQKAQVDKEIELTRQEVENVNEQIHQYNMLIAEKQAELDELELDQQALNARYQKRMRAIQERGEISRWAVVFQSQSFVDMLNRVAMVEEIAKADQRMMEEMREAAAAVLAAKEELAAEKTQQELKKTELADAEALLEEKRAESDALLIELNANKEKLIEETEKYEQLEAELSDQIAKKEQEYNEARAAEIAAQQQQQQQQQQNNGSTSDAPVNTGESFLYPLAYYGVVTSSYGYRVHPITGNYSMHNGVDLAVNQGTAIYATKSGTVTTATYNYAYGYYVTINHGDGFSSLYGHMTHYTVSEGQYVSKGEIIGYVGSTGYSTGPHLHFTVYYNGSTVNPMSYL